MKGYFIFRSETRPVNTQTSAAWLKVCHETVVPIKIILFRTSQCWFLLSIIFREGLHTLVRTTHIAMTFHFFIVIYDRSRTSNLCITGKPSG